ncbi:VOC family protein [Gemmobacter sp.]|uniref:VOC family protein n=1 Tax=Gemmobacter sp. TaxID=1898957 RepID=UPI002AFF87C7|nr:VOC family protein [Gemmobacter sp.]
MTITPAPLIRGVNHVSFTVTDLDGPIAFFRDGLGFALTSRAGRPAALAADLTGVPGADVEIAFLTGPGLVLELIRFLAPARADGPLPAANCPSAAHVALETDALDRGLDIARRFGLRQVGRVVQVATGPNRGRRLVYLQHPAGVNIELVSDAEIR